MPNVRHIFMALAVALLLAVPAAPGQVQNPDQSTPTTLYFHIWDPFNKFVINTQPYNASFFDVGGVNVVTSPETGDFNTIYGYSTSGPVEYEFIEAGRPRIHPERGIAADVRIDDSVPTRAYLYVDARGLQGADDTPGVLPEVTFSVTMRQGDDPGSDLDAGEVIMSGETTAYLFDGKWCPNQIANAAQILIFGCLVEMDIIHGGGTAPLPGTGNESLPSEAPDGTPILYPDAENVIEIPIDLELASSTIPKEESYNIRLDWYQEVGGAFGDDEFFQGNMRMVLDDDHLPRLEMNVLNPVYIEFIHPQVAAGTLLIHTGVNSPWGTYDVAAEEVELTIDGPSQPQSLQRVVAQNQHVHGLHDQAAEITYLWKFRDEGAAEGDYTITLSVPNAAGTAEAVGTAGFTIEGQKAFGISDKGEVVEPAEDEGSQDTPFGGLLAALALLGAVLVARRRSA